MKLEAGILFQASFKASLKVPLRASLDRSFLDNRGSGYTPNSHLGSELPFECCLPYRFVVFET